MKLLPTALAAVAAAASLVQASGGLSRLHHSANGAKPLEAAVENIKVAKAPDAIAPKVVVMSLFEPEMAAWHQHLNFTHNVTVPGLSPLFPHVFCVDDYSICNVVTGEGEINAAVTVTALTFSPKFDLSKTYVLVAGIGGVNPHKTTLAGVTLARYAVSVGMQSELDYRSVASHNWSTGWFAYGTEAPGQYPTKFYGTEVFEFNEALRDRVYDLAQKATLADVASAQDFRKLYPYAPANQPPSVVKCDAATSDGYYTGFLLADAFGKVMNIWTNGTAEYCSTAQEDTAIAEAFVRAAKLGLVDYNRFVLMRSASDFDREPPSMDPVEYFTKSSRGHAFSTAVTNLYHAGWPFVNDVVKNWEKLYENNTFTPKNYVGDVFGTLGGNPDFGPGRNHNWFG